MLAEGCSGPLWSTTPAPKRADVVGGNAPVASKNLLKAAKEHEAAGDLAAAAEAIGRFLSIRPNHAEGHFVLARIMAAAGHLQPARDAALRAVALDGQQAGAAVLVARIEAARGDHELASQALDHALSVKPTAEVMVMRGDVEVARGAPEAALGWYRRAMALDPGFHGAYLNAAMLLGNQDRGNEAIELLRAGIAGGARPEAPLHFNLGNRLYHAGDYAGAISAFQLAALAAPDNPDPLINMALVHEVQADFVKAVEILSRARRLAPDSVNVRGNLAAALTELNLLDDALTLFEGVVVDAPDEPRFLLGHAIALFKRKRLDESERQARRAGRLPQAHNLLAQIHLARDQPDLAIAACRDALAISPRFAEALLTMAQAMQAKGDDALAEAMTEEALAIRPDYAGALVNRGLLLQRRAQISDAMECYDRALFIDPNLKEARLNRTTLLLTLGRIDDAIVGYRDIVARHPDDVMVWMGLANALADKGEFADAIDAYDRAIALDPTHAPSNWNKAMALLRAGRGAEAWSYYDYRFDAGAVTLFAFPQPWWRGEDLSGRSILVWAEQGVGDQIALSPLAASLAARAKETFLASDPRLVALVQRSLGPAVRCVPLAAGATCGAELQTATASVPQYLRPRPGGQPVAMGWLACDPGLVAAHRAWLESLGNRPRVGLCWRSSLRSIERDKSYADLIEDWPTLLGGLDAVWVDLQYDDSAREVAALAEATGIELHRPPDLDQYNDLDGVAALLCNLPIVLSAPTALAQLAMGVGVETYIVADRGGTSAFPPVDQIPDGAMFYAARQQLGDWRAMFTRLNAHLRARLPHVKQISDSRLRGHYDPVHMLIV